MLYGSEVWCLKECEMGILQRTERFMVGAMCRVQLRKQKKICGFDVLAGFKGNYLSVGNGKQCLLALSCVEETGWSRLKKGIRF